MTIAVGFVCADGTLLAADTKESYPDSQHTYVNKLCPFESGDLDGAVVGAGDAAIVDYIAPRIIKRLKANKGYSLEKHESEIEQLMSEIYESKAIKAYPVSSQEDLLTSFLLLVRPHLRKQSALFAIHSSLVTRIEEGAAVIGYALMQDMADEMCRVNDLAVQEAAIAAMYLIYEAKRRTGDVGGVSHVYRLADKFAPRADRIWDQPRRESLFDSLRQVHYGNVIMAANTSLKAKEFTTALKRLSSVSREIWKEFQTIENEFQQWQLSQLGMTPEQRMYAFQQLLRDAEEERKRAEKLKPT